MESHRVGHRSNRMFSWDVGTRCPWEVHSDRFGSRVIRRIVLVSGFGGWRGRGQCAKLVRLVLRRRDPSALMRDILSSRAKFDKDQKIA